MEHSNVIGAGNNPVGPDLRPGIGTELARHPRAMQTFGGMTSAEKVSLIRHIQGAASGEDAQTRINEAINKLNNRQTDFFY